MRVNVWVYGREDFEPLGLITDAESVYFERSFTGIGTMQIAMSALRRNAALLQPGNVVRIGEHKDMAGILTRRRLSTERGRQRIVAEGVQLKGVFASRVIVPPTAAEDAAAYGWDRVATAAGETVLRHYVSRHIVSPVDANRKIVQVVMETAASPLRGTETPWQAQWTSLAEEMESICRWCSLGYNLDLDIANRQWVYRTLQGHDLTGRDGSLTRVTFSPAFRNVVNVAYEEDYSAVSNSIYALGGGEDEDQVVRLIYADENGDPLESGRAGTERLETTISVGSLSLPDEIDYEAYHNLKTSARQIKTLTATINTGGPFAYRKDWDLGDIVTVRLSLREMGETISMHAPITGITEIYERDGLDPRLDVTFGEGRPTLSQAIDRRIRRR